MPTKYCMFYGSITLRGLQVSGKNIQLNPSENTINSHSGLLFDWAVPEGSLGSHKVGEKLYTTLSATYGDQIISDYKVSAGAVPSDIALNNSSAVLNGVLTVSGHFVFTIRAAVNNVCSDATYSVDVQA